MPGIIRRPLLRSESPLPREILFYSWLHNKSEMQPRFGTTIGRWGRITVRFTLIPNQTIYFLSVLTLDTAWTSMRVASCRSVLFFPHWKASNIASHCIFLSCFFFSGCLKYDSVYVDLKLLALVSLCLFQACFSFHVLLSALHFLIRLLQCHWMEAPLALLCSRL